MDSKYEVIGDMNGLKDMINQKTTICDHKKNSLNYEKGGDNSDCYIVDLENFSNGVDIGNSNIQSTTTNMNSRITLQRSLSRKVSQRGTEKKLNDIDVLAPSSSPRAIEGVSTQQKSLSPSILPMGSQDHRVKNHQQLPHHQITIKTSGMNTIHDGKLSKRSSFNSSSNSWFSDPKRILLFFATMSSMGTMLLIYFTLLSVSKANDQNGISDFQ